MKKIIFLAFIFLLSTGNLLSQPRVWNLESLNKAKSERSAAKDQLFKDANKALTKNISSVMDKVTPAPSGDLHDYISCAPYWWPDPANPTGPYIRKDGVSNKAVLTTDKKNLATMANSIVNLSLAYYLTSQEKYAAKAVENLRIWFLNPKTRMNPNVNFGQTIFGHFGGKGRGAGMIETYKFVDMLDGIELLKKSIKFTAPDQQGLQSWFTEYLNWMMTSEVGNQEYKAKNNHGTAFDVQLTRVALFVGKENIARKYIDDFAARRIFAQIEPDGKQPLELARTKALHYSTFNLTHILDMCYIAKTLNINLFNAKSSDGRSISKALDFMAQFAGKPQSQFQYSQINSWDEDQNFLYLQLYRTDKLTGNSDYQKLYENTKKESKKNYNYILF